MFPKLFDEYIAFEERLKEVVREKGGDIKNVFARVNTDFNPQTLTLVNDEIVTIFAEIDYVADEEIASISFNLMRQLINEGYMQYRFGSSTVFIYTFFMDNFIDFEEALEE